MARKAKKKLSAVEADRRRRMKWWHEARFGMFVHWGLYALVGRHEFAVNQERIPWDEYFGLAESWRPKPRAARAWAKLAKQAGQKYMVFTARHHDGYSLWDTQQSDCNCVKTGPGRDLVAEFVDAAREQGLRAGLYYSLMDWHHPDGLRCLHDAAARRRFLDYVRGQLRELMTDYGKIDVLWYDVPYPLPNAAAWEMRRTNRMVRRLQPDIIINDRCALDEDYATPEESIRAAPAGRAWEAAMTFNGSWGYMDTPDEDYRSARHVLFMLQQVTQGGGNLLLNIGPAPDGSVPPPAVERLRRIGKWLEAYGEAVYGAVDPAEGLCPLCNYVEWTRKGNTAYAWLRHWPGERMDLGFFKGKVRRVRLLTPSGPRAVKFTQAKQTLSIWGLPKTCPDKTVGYAILKIECASRPQRMMAGHYQEAPAWLTFRR